MRGTVHRYRDKETRMSKHCVESSQDREEMSVSGILEMPDYTEMWL